MSYIQVHQVNLCLCSVPVRLWGLTGTKVDAEPSCLQVQVQADLYLVSTGVSIMGPKAH